MGNTTTPAVPQAAAALQDAKAPTQLDNKVWIGLTVGILISFITACSAIYGATMFIHEFNCFGAASTLTTSDLNSNYLNFAIVGIVASVLSAMAHFRAVTRDSVACRKCSKTGARCVLSLPTCGR